MCIKGAFPETQHSCALILFYTEVTWLKKISQGTIGKTIYLIYNTHRLNEKTFENFASMKAEE